MRNHLSKYQILNISRNKIYLVYLLMIYIFPVFIGPGGKFFLSNNYWDYVYLFNFHQMVIVFANVLPMIVFVNENVFKLIDNYLCLYIKDIKRYFGAICKQIILFNLSAFVMGQLVLILFNFLHGNSVPITLFLVNTIIVSIEITASVFFSMSLVLVLKKRILVIMAYVMAVTIMMLSNNIYFSFPLSMSLLQYYYQTFSFPLWLGRGIILLLSFVMFHIIKRSKLKAYT